MTQLNAAARALLESDALAHLVTLSPSGAPQLSIVWVGLNGDEMVTIRGIATIKPRQTMEAEILDVDGSVLKVPLLCRIDTLDELEYYRNGGILHYVLRKLAA